jgi:hypothetical protein
MKTYFSLLLTLLAFTTNAQKKNYIIKHSGDTIFGDYIITNKLVKVIQAATKDTVNINSEEVWQAVSNNKSKVVLRCILYGYTDNFETVMYPGYLDPVYDTTLLLKPIITGGRLNLFSAKDKRKVDYFFVQGQNDSVPVQLLYNVGGQMPDKANWGTRNPMYQLISYVTYFKIFADQLNEMTADCDSITEGDIKLLQYMESSIKAFIKKYNKKCSK